MKVKTCVIILNLNGKNFLKNCLTSIQKNNRDKSYKIIVVDNGSTDKSQEMVKKYFKRVDLIKNLKNLGFSGGNNQGADYAIKKYNPDYIYFLNNDTLVKENWLEEAVRCADLDNSVGIVGSKQLTFEEKPAHSAGWIKMLNTKYYDGKENKEVNWVSGAGFLIRTDLIKKIGLFDMVYNPAYYEETDLEKRALNAGFKIIFCPTSIFLHRGGGDIKNNKIRQELFYRNRVIYFLRYYPFVYFLPRVAYDIFLGIKQNKIKIILSGYSEGIKIYWKIKKRNYNL